MSGLADVIRGWADSPDVSGGTAGTEPASPGVEQYTPGQHQASQDATAAAQQAAQQAYWEAVAQNQGDTLAFEKAKEAAQEALSAMDLSAKLSGPANAFQQMAVDYGLNQLGFSKLAADLTGQTNLPRFQAPQQQPQAATLATLVAQMNGANAANPWGPVPTGSGSTTQPAPSGSQPSVPAATATSGTAPGPVGPAVGSTAASQPFTAPSPMDAGGSGPYPPSVQAFLNALPTPNQIVGRSYDALSPDAQKFVQSAYAAKGYAPGDVTAAVKAGLPGAGAGPSYGLVQDGTQGVQ